MAGKMLAGCFGLSIAMNSWGAIKAQQMPWPGTFIRIGIAFSIIGVVETYNAEFADLLAAAFTLASLVNLATTQGTSGPWTAAFGAIPPANTGFYTLGWGALPGGAATPSGTGGTGGQPFIGPIGPGLTRPGG